MDEKIDSFYEQCHSSHNSIAKSGAKADHQEDNAYLG
jgi:hypothetical protein